MVKEQVDMLCLQKTKKEREDKTMCQALWGDSEEKWATNPTMNNARGILCVWSESSFVLENEVIGSEFILLKKAIGWKRCERIAPMTVPEVSVSKWKGI